MIVNCGRMGLDWERLSLSGYLEAMEHFNAQSERPSGGEPHISADLDRLGRFHRAHVVR